jgi:Transposase, Mutator family
MTDVTQDRDQAGAGLSAADEQVLRELTERARAGGLKLTGEGGLLGKLTKMVIEGALEGELDDHLGYGKHDPEGRDGGNSRNGRPAKTVLTDTGPVEISVPRDPTPGTLGVSACSGCCGLRVPCLSWCLFSRLRWRCPGMAAARVSRRAWRAVPRSVFPGGRGGSSFLTVSGLGSGLAGAGREHGDLGFPGDGCLGRGGVREFRAGFLSASGVALPAGDVEGVQGGAGGGVARGGDRFQRR